MEESGAVCCEPVCCEKRVPMSLMTERHDAIAETMAEVRTLSDQLGPTTSSSKR